MKTSESPDPFLKAREELVDQIVDDPRSRVTDPRVIAAMRATPRHRFVPPESSSEAYYDHPLSIGHGQTISQPSLVAYMTQLLEPRPTDRILEIGTGSGYQAAVLSPLVAAVFTIEIVSELAEKASQIFDELGCKNVKTRTGDGSVGWPDAAPFDAIMVTCAPDEIPPALVDQLAEGGRLIIPVGPQGEPQELYLLEKHAGNIERRAILPVQFVPMTGGGLARAEP